MAKMMIRMDNSLIVATETIFIVCKCELYSVNKIVANRAGQATFSH